MAASPRYFANSAARSNAGPGTGAGAGPHEGWIDPGALTRIRSLQMRARVVVEGFLRGIHRSPYHGFSVEFSEHRQYAPGDDPRYLDWRVFARSDRYYIKRFEDETNARCQLVLDVSRSMSYRSAPAPWGKGEYARTAAATIAYFLWSQRDAVGLTTFDDRIVEHLPARYRPGHLRRLAAILDRASTGRATDLGLPLERVAAALRKRGLVVVVSDFLAPSGPLKSGLGQLRARGHDVVVLRVLDPAEASFPFEAPEMFLDMESGREMDVDPAEARAGYARRFAAHAAEIDRACADLGVEYHSITIERPLELILFDLLRARTLRLAAAAGRRRAAGPSRDGGGEGGRPT